MIYLNLLIYITYDITYILMHILLYRLTSIDFERLESLQFSFSF